MNFVANVPYIKCYIRKEYLYDLEKGHGEFEECVLISVKSMQGRALMFEAYIPAYAACFDKFPLTAFVWKTDIKEEEQLLADSITDILQSKGVSELKLTDGSKVSTKEQLYCSIK